MARFSDTKLIQMAENMATNTALTKEIHASIHGPGGMRDQMVKMNGRISNLEKWRNWLSGAYATAVGIGSALFAHHRSK